MDKLGEVSKGGCRGKESNRGKKHEQDSHKVEAEIICTLQHICPYPTSCVINLKTSLQQAIILNKYGRMTGDNLLHMLQTQYHSDEAEGFGLS